VNPNPDPRDPWDRRPGETPKAYAAFLDYRNMGAHKRSLRAMTAREHNPDAVHLAVAMKWSRENDWVDRVGSWDDFLARQDQIEQVEQVHAMRRRHAALGFQMLDIAAERVRAINIEKLTVREALMLADLGIKIERQARGETVTIDELRTDAELDGPTGADILTALRTHPQLLDLADELDRVMLEGTGSDDE
jgi:hypothetical protein